ncbi:MAG: response regulator, partial [Thiotrichales bacterium]|nr:response regulator [Thiotrichales bacterium]
MTLTATHLSDEPSIRPASILVVDDDATVCRTISTFLQSRNYQVTTVQDGTTALKQLERHNFDLVFLDLMMPGVSGIKVLKSIREKYTPLQLPVIMLTVSEDVTDIVVSFESGANDYIIKPGTLPVMIARIETQLSLKSMNDTLCANKKDLEREIINKEVAYEIAKANLETEMDTRIETEKALHISE